MDIPNEINFRPHKPLRRDFLRVGSLSLLGMHLSQYLEMQSALAATGGRTNPNAKAQACIVLWLEGGPSHVDTWDPKPNSNFKAISTNVDGIQISELLPRIAKNMDKLSIIRSMHTEEIDHPEGHHYGLDGTPAESGDAVSEHRVDHPLGKPGRARVFRPTSFAPSGPSIASTRIISRLRSSVLNTIPCLCRIPARASLKFRT